MDYRSQALKLLPHVCARCGREFAGRRRRELTVHHKDGNHHNNPPDGSNWELLCIYCHENEHARVVDGSPGFRRRRTRKHRKFLAGNFSGTAVEHEARSGHGDCP